MENTDWMIRYAILAFLITLCNGGFLTAQERLSLERAFQVALQQNYGIEMSRKSLEISRTENHPGNAGLLPQVSLISGVNYASNNSKQTFFDGTDRSADWAGNFTFNTGVQADYRLYDGGAARNRKQRLEKLEDLTEQQVEVMARELLTRLSRTYYTILYYDDTRRLIEESIAFFEDLENLERERLDIGRGTRLSLLQTQSELNREKARLEQVKSWRQVAMQDLFRIMNIEPDDELELEEEDYYDQAEVDPDALLAKVLTNNPELILETMQQFVLESELDISRAEQYPTLDMSAGVDYSLTLSEVGLLESNRNFGPFVGATLRMNIFDGHRSRKNIEVNQLRLEMGSLQLADLRSELETELQKRYLEFKNSNKMLEIERENLELVRQNLELADEMFQAGRIDNFELREVQQQLVRAEEALAAIRRDRAMAYIDLMALTGL
ncbi:MAG: TolC family protein [Saprospirales bacterium]|nr:MAG: TolC family protein [Saprospirales bacterium]